MMPVKKALQLQAWVDGELTPSEAREIEAWINQDAEAQRLTDELRSTGVLLKNNESVRTVPESREFYWSKIERVITARQASMARPSAEPSRGWWRQWFVPAGAVAGALALVAALRLASGLGEDSAVLALGHEVDTPIENVSSFTFRSETAQMTVVWVDFEPE